ncbi:hypothetical protein, partial [Hyella patelloides]|uniref:hypothetical protein n=1 Tax=Hyella patelloides TaxID=1982969 RepID=UPI001C96AB4F
SEFKLYILTLKYSKLLQQSIYNCFQVSCMNLFAIALTKINTLGSILSLKEEVIIHCSLSIVELGCKKQDRSEIG